MENNPKYKNKTYRIGNTTGYSIFINSDEIKEKEIEHGDTLYFGQNQEFSLYFDRQIINSQTEIYDILPTKYSELFKAKHISHAKSTQIPQICFFDLFLCNSEKQYYLQFPDELQENSYKIGISEDAVVKLSKNKYTEDSKIYANIKRHDEYKISHLPIKKQCEIFRMLKFCTNLRISDTIFKLENFGQFGTVVSREIPFLIEPNTMELFQIGNLLIQISRY